MEKQSNGLPELTALNSDIVFEDYYRYIWNLAIKINNKFHPKSMTIEDLVNEGVFGFYEAKKRFKPELGYKFTTYSRFWIIHYIKRSIKNKDKLVRTPFHLYSEEKHTYLDVNKYDIEDLSKEDKIINIQDLRIELRKLCECLGEREKFVINCRFFRNMSLKKVGIILGVSKERVRQIQDSAIKRIRHKKGKLSNEFSSMYN